MARGQLDLHSGMAVGEIDILDQPEGDYVSAEARIFYLLEEFSNLFFIHVEEGGGWLKNAHPTQRMARGKLFSVENYFSS